MLLDHLRAQLAERDTQRLRRRLRVSETPCAPHVQVSTPGGATAERLAFCSNDYLGLANHPTLVAAVGEGARQWGAGSGASHLISGHSRAHAQLEDRLADWLAPHIPEARALLFCTGYMANLAVLTALGDGRATLFCEKLNHASLIDGALLAKAELVRYPHADTAWLERRLAACTSPIKLIVTDAVFSMDGTLAPLPELLQLAERHDAWLVVDDAHGFGVLGEHGQGTLAHFGLRSQRLIYMGTLGKAAGLAGAFVAAHPLIIEWLINAGRPYIYTTASPPALAHALQASLNLIASDEGQARRAHLAVLIAALRDNLPAALAERGWRLAESVTAIQPLLVGDNETALALSAALDEQGLWVPAIRPPTVPVGTARLRITLSAAHSLDDVGTLHRALADAARTLP